MKIILQLKAGFREDRQIRGFVSYCPAFDIYSQGQTVEEAIDALKSAIRMTLEHSFRKGRLEEMLRTALREHRDAIFMTPQLTSETPVAVPLNLVVQEQKYASNFSPRPV